MSPSYKTNFKVRLDLDVFLDDEGLRPNIVVRNIAVAHKHVEEKVYVNNSLELEEEND